MEGTVGVSEEETVIISGASQEVITTFLQIASIWCEKHCDASDLDTLEGQRYRIAATSTANALATLTGERDTIIRKAMEHGRRNMDAFVAWCNATGREWSQTAYAPENDYVRWLQEATERG